MARTRVPFLPRRISVQSAMMLTFALLVGGAVVLVGLYSFFVLRGEIHRDARRALLAQADRVAEQVAAAPDEAAALDVARQTSALTGLDVTVASGDRRLGHFGRPTPPALSALEAPEAARVVEVENGAEAYITARASAGASGLTVTVGERAPPLYAAVHKVQGVLAVSMALALLVALVGAWLASRQVVRPLRAITRNAERIAGGELDRSLFVRTRTKEFTALTRSLNRMAAQFREDIDELKRVQRVQNEFIGNVSHEVKNPIFAVFGYLEALASDGLGSEQRKRYAQKGLANLTRLNNLFSDLIEIAKLEYREDMVRPERFDMQDLIAEVGEMLEPKAEEKGLELTYDNAPLEVFADRNRIRQVLTNLIDNAIAYSEEGSVRCRMRRHLDKARIGVVDTGRGIGQEHLDRIFERFYRVDTARSRKMGGTGLGLAITKQILEAHGTTPHVESTKGRGTRFWFELPLDDDFAEATAEEIASLAQIG